MYCGQCGKKVLETMLFCPFCGSPIVIPDQDETAVEKTAPVPPKPAIEDQQLPLRPVSLFDGYEPLPESEILPENEQEEIFTPLIFDVEEETEPRTEPAPEPIPEAEPAPQPDNEKPAQRPSAQTRRPANNQNRQANTYIPVKELSPDDIFMDDVDHDGDAYDDGYDDDYDRRASRYEDHFDDDFEFEEGEHGTFFQRHIRGIVGLILLLVMAAICAIWAFSPNGQLTLAKMNLAWSADAYADLGYEAYMQKSTMQAAKYYEKAYSRDNTNYEYAHSAMVAYYDAGETESAAAMLKKCIEMDPDNPEPYQEMLVLYPDKADRPWEVSELIRLGYQRTGDAALKPD